ncbi:hypothetical protein GCM10011402_31330 [Paracoccus acridae]|uniref:Integrase catalytic domain-containing protein n=1 Tax=Paracoccus acridae TaxID=1795310 RepID=A0ABQ1VMQ6_9RHOB|nr:hypothetical protein GCM10011402_31330 [Paracoccus acridae]
MPSTFCSPHTQASGLHEYLRDAAAQRRGRTVSQTPPCGEVQQIATEWLWTYNHQRPNKGIGGITPTMKLKMAAWL